MKRAIVLLMLLAAPLVAAEPLKIGGPVSIAAYKIVRLSPVNADVEAAVIWDIDKEEDCDVEELADGRLLFTAPPGTYKVKLRTLKGKTVQTARITVVIGEAPGPGPAPPKPDPPAPTSKIVFVVVVEETADRTGATARLLGDLGFWSSLTAKGVGWHVFDKDAAEVTSKGYKPYADKVGLPALILLDDKGGARAVKLPATTTEILKEIGR